MDKYEALKNTTDWIKNASSEEFMKNFPDSQQKNENDLKIKDFFTVDVLNEE